MRLYKVQPSDGESVHVVAHTDRQAADVFITWRAAHRSAPDRFSIECVRINSLNPAEQAQVRSAFALALVGIARFDDEFGWTFSATMWPPLDVDE